MPAWYKCSFRQIKSNLILDRQKYLESTIKAECQNLNNNFTVKNLRKPTCSKTWLNVYVFNCHVPQNSWQFQVKSDDVQENCTICFHCGYFPVHCFLSKVRTMTSLSYDKQFISLTFQEFKQILFSAHIPGRRQCVIL